MSQSPIRLIRLILVKNPTKISLRLQRVGQVSYFSRLRGSRWSADSAGQALGCKLREPQTVCAKLDE